MKATVFRVHLGGHFVSPAPQWLGFEFPNFPVLVVPWYPMLSDKSLHAQFQYLSIVRFMFIHAHWCFFTLLLRRLGKTHEKRHLDISSFSSHEMQKTLFHCVLISPWMFGVFCFTPVGDKLVDPVLPIEMWWQIRGFFQGEKPVAALCLKHQLVYTFCDGWLILDRLHYRLSAYGYCRSCSDHSLLLTSRSRIGVQLTGTFLPNAHCVAGGPMGELMQQVH